MGQRRQLEEAVKQSFIQFISEPVRKDIIAKQLGQLVSQTGVVVIDMEELYRANHDLHDIFVREAYALEPVICNALYTFATEECDEELKRMFQEAQFTPKNIEFIVKNLGITYRLRDIQSSFVGRLISIQGQITRTTEVRPELVEATFVCQMCGTKESGIEQQFRYTTPVRCSNQTCSNSRNWDLLITESIFSDWQKVMLQESADELPSGCLPRRLDVVLRRTLADTVKAGDKCVFTGILLAVPDAKSLRMPGVTTRTQGENYRDGREGPPPPAAGQNKQRGTGGAEFVGQGVAGLRDAGGKELGYSFCLLATNVESTADKERESPFCEEEDNGEDDVEVQEDGGSGKPKKKRSSSDGLSIELSRMGKTLSLKPFARECIRRLRRLFGARDEMAQPYPQDTLTMLASNVAPAVFGHLNVKMGLCLALVGGVRKMTSGGNSVPLRGDINVLIVGDPSSAKSQLLRSLSTVAPHSVYATGQSSSAAGLTAAVVKEVETGEFTVEPGAMILADNGMCIIDEFEKMNENDMVAIHEGMEQQTITISKAGINASFNARCSVVAAANPNFGKYRTSEPLSANISLSPAILSRFDLFFVIVDEVNETIDRQLARFVIHNKSRPPQFLVDAPEFPAFSNCFPSFDVSTPVGSSTLGSSSIHRKLPASSNSLASTSSSVVTNSSISVLGAAQPSCSISKEDLCTYFAVARQIQPKWTTEGFTAVEEYYVAGRQRDKVTRGASGMSSGLVSTTTSASSLAPRLTARQIESLIRVSEAVAKLNLDMKVSKEHVNIAWSLIQQGSTGIAGSALGGASGRRRPGDDNGRDGNGRGIGGGRGSKTEVKKEATQTVVVEEVMDAEKGTVMSGVLQFEVDSNVADLFEGNLHQDEVKEAGNKTSVSSSKENEQAMEQEEEGDNDKESEGEHKKMEKRTFDQMKEENKENEKEKEKLSEQKKTVRVTMSIERFNNLRNFILMTIWQKGEKKPDGTKRLMQKDILQIMVPQIVKEMDEEIRKEVEADAEKDDEEDDDDEYIDEEEEEEKKRRLLSETEEEKEERLQRKKEEKLRKRAERIRKMMVLRLSQQASELRLVIEKMLRSDDQIMDDSDEETPSSQVYSLDKESLNISDKRYIALRPEFSMNQLQLND
ncbi:DNA replication licensing factor MCM6 [Monocercomonoides exilis]|uniref:DNA replication licensing factor MCM6 n=1 Tax=Monocercomonoides exilis TaxID=2049356 RepID=UPI00355A73CE|nr:DNA replication licensing factor MCM6 [Monocercomonoides exilis]|eukprot:MONOS_9896.1-p1 / transcript=MONOS_9896.1 / gene=MONOS_9896 / organism=Monocercomonoides_exilis_PA203 / gene_product=DNA replication licensing factor MCM6 / transcript_product=DNA replication licensing factor MCM6 / location=Mono_scaffold00425:27576-31212(-) / protein_length=1135 / sequence_SO=supercontig / SO=protein_coding / is_pseudo=false